ncbi:peptidoglycan-binding domain-containing protein [Streptomyces sp. NPDC048106]|uniref:peptidoglycan-binding domain-containing protein n=1 Tax=Streptomyces sp. NPDC048106 TaxID=3155750 RepID=UPI003453BA28
MTGERGTACPECGTPRDAAGAPSCDCAARTAEALHRTRTAQAAAAEDFDPLRIRPYVDVGPVEGAGEDEGEEPRHVEATLPMRAVAGPAASGVRLFDEPPREPEPPGTGEPGRRRRFGRTALIAAAGVGVAVVAAAGLALFSYQTPSRDDAAPEVRESVPDVPAPDPSAPSPHDTTGPSGSTARQAPPPPAATPTRSPSSSPTPTPTPSRTPSGTPSPTASAPDAPASAAVVLRRGDSGPQVAELEYRLRQLNLYGGDVNGVYTHPVENAVSTYQLARGLQGDPLGVYGPKTRASLESETSAP